MNFKLHIALGLAALLLGGAVDVMAYGGKKDAGQEVAGKKGGESLPADLVDVGITEHLGETIPLDGVFADESGQPVKLSSFFKPGKPVLLNFAYFRCPMLCNLVMNGMIGGLKKLPWTPGNEFEIVTLSIDPNDGHEVASEKKKNHIAELGRPEAAAGWHFLTSKEEEVKRVADAIGFKYQYLRGRDDYAHQAAVFTISPEGKISRYLYGTEYRSKNLRLALLDASEGKALSIGEKIEMFCYRYDPEAKGYVLFARNFMRGGGYIVMALLFLLLGNMWRKEIKKNRAKAPVSAGSAA